MGGATLDIKSAHCLRDKVINFMIILPLLIQLSALNTNIPAL